MRVVVTGSAGRLGRNVCAVLAEAGHAVTGLDRVEHPGGRVVDLTDAEATRSVIAELEPEAVVHLAAIAIPFSAPEHVIFRVNTTMAFTVIEAAILAGATRVLAASSPTVFGYGTPGWRPARLPLDESERPKPSNAYSLSKVVVEETVEAFARANPAVRLAAFRPCYVIAPEEWDGALTQQGHTIVDRLLQPELAAVSLFNYVDARDVGDFIGLWLDASSAPSGATYLVGATDALATSPLAELVATYHPDLGDLASGLTGTEPAFDCSAAGRDLGWRARRSWRTELPANALPERTHS